MKRKKANWIGHILGKNYLLRHCVEGEMGGKKRDVKTSNKT
jgi:hypothetical protein